MRRPPGPRARRAAAKRARASTSRRRGSASILPTISDANACVSRLRAESSADPSRAEIEQGVVVDVTRRRGVLAAHVVREDLELRRAADASRPREQQVLILLLSVGLLSVLSNDDAPMEDPFRLAVQDALEELPAGPMRAGVVDGRVHVHVLRRSGQEEAVERAIGALAVQDDGRVVARDGGSEADRDACEPGIAPEGRAARCHVEAPIRPRPGPCSGARPRRPRRPPGWLQSRGTSRPRGLRAARSGSAGFRGPTAPGSGCGTRPAPRRLDRERPDGPAPRTTVPAATSTKAPSSNEAAFSSSNALAERSVPSHLSRRAGSSARAAARLSPRDPAGGSGASKARGRTARIRTRVGSRSLRAEPRAPEARRWDARSAHVRSPRRCVAPLFVPRRRQASFDEGVHRRSARTEQPLGLGAGPLCGHGLKGLAETVESGVAHRTAPAGASSSQA